MVETNKLETMAWCELLPCHFLVLQIELLSGRGNAVQCADCNAQERAHALNGQTVVCHLSYPLVGG